MLLALTTGLHAAGSSAGQPAELVTDFYKAYLNRPAASGPQASRPELPRSRGFENLIRKSRSICQTHAVGPCGFQSDGDVYLNAQDFDSALTFPSAVLSISRSGARAVDVRIDVMPSDTLHGDRHLRNIRYAFVKEHGSWVVDDIVYDQGGSIRKSLRDEIRFLASHPEEGSARWKHDGRADR